MRLDKTIFDSSLKTALCIIWKQPATLLVETTDVGAFLETSIMYKVSMTTQTFLIPTLTNDAGHTEMFRYADIQAAVYIHFCCNTVYIVKEFDKKVFRIFWGRQNWSYYVISCMISVNNLQRETMCLLRETIFTGVQRTDRELHYMLQQQLPKAQQQQTQGACCGLQCCATPHNLKGNTVYRSQ